MTNSLIRMPPVPAIGPAAIQQILRKFNSIISCSSGRGNSFPGGAQAFLKVKKGLQKTTFFGKLGVPTPNPNRGRSR
jgi:hypothetical protein